jgi:hypothetical protein
VVWWSCDVWGEVTNVSSPAFWVCWKVMLDSCKQHCTVQYLVP